MHTQDYHIRDAAACALALLHMAQATPACFSALTKGGLLRALAALYERSIHPSNQSSNVTPGDACAIILHAMAMEPW